MNSHPYKAATLRRSAAVFDSVKPALPEFSLEVFDQMPTDTPLRRRRKRGLTMWVSSRTSNAPAIAPAFRF